MPALIVATGATALADRPAAADNSTLQYFPPIGGPQEMGDCTCWSSAYYYSTYMQARDEGLNAASGSPSVICSHRFLFPLIAEGGWGAECTERAMEHLSEVGCATAALHPLTAWYTDWPTEAAWVAALRNRMGPLHKIRADNEAGLETVKQHIADGGVAVTRALFHANYPGYGDTATGAGISNRVMYMGVGGNYLRHSLCIAGYDDDRSYFDTRDGQTHYGAFLIANSEGPNWGWYNSTGTGTKGFLWVAYAMFLEGEFGRYDHDDNPYVDNCYDNPPYPTVYFHDDRPQYRPALYAVAGLNHESRNLLMFSGGVGPTSAPEFIGPNAIEWTDQGDLPIDDSRRVAVDLTDGADLIPPGETKNLYVSVALAGGTLADATISSVDFYYDFDGDGLYLCVPGEMTGNVTVHPGTTGYVSASITNAPVFGLGDMNCDRAVNAFDIDPFVLALVNPSSYATTYPDCDRTLGDCNRDGWVNAFDIDGFVALIVAGP